MTQLFVQLAHSVTGNVITIVALELAAAIIGFIIAWLYARSVYTPVIKGLETDKKNLNSQIDKLKDDYNALNEKVNRLSEKKGKLGEQVIEKENEINALSAEPDQAVIETTPKVTEPGPIGKYVIGKAKNGEHYFNLKATNGQVILTSGMFSSLADCLKGIESVREICVDNNSYERKKSSNNKPYFNLKASNGQISGKSELYESVASMEKGISSVKRNGISKVVIEE
jgi:hypothetical protein